MKPADLEHAALSVGQKKLLGALACSSLCSTFYLSGGSALGGVYLRHRISRDLDLFTADDVPLETTDERIRMHERVSAPRPSSKHNKLRERKVPLSARASPPVDHVHQELADGVEGDRLLEVIDEIERLAACRTGDLSK